MRLSIVLLLAACTGREIVSRPADTGPDTGPFELDVPSYALQGQIYDVDWGPASDAFAIDDGGGAYRIFVAPFPLNACDEGERLTENVLYAEIPALQEAPWGEDGAEVTLGTSDGLLTTTGGGYDLKLDVTETKVVGGLLFDVDPKTRLQGQVEAPLCP
jgi:hypothetical protein